MAMSGDKKYWPMRTQHRSHAHWSGMWTEKAAAEPSILLIFGMDQQSGYSSQNMIPIF